ncbi:MAG: 30S ribosomal protein S7 [Acholeplasmatales bacterium]|nr:30S ribosomal protein S7 [Acholeplasmatales bacterium]
MPRKGHIAKRDVLPDPIYNSKVVTRTINTIMLDGKKGTAQTILYSAFDRIQEVTGQEPLEVFNKALENIMPIVEVKSRRIGGQNYQVPVEVRPERKQTLGLRWLIKYARLRGDKTMDEKLAKEIMDAANGLGGACKKREDTHKMAEANKAFAHYRW